VDSLSILYQENANFVDNVEVAFVFAARKGFVVPTGAEKSLFVAIGKRFHDLKDWVVAGKLSIPSFEG